MTTNHNVELTGFQFHSVISFLMKISQDRKTKMQHGQINSNSINDFNVHKNWVWLQFILRHTRECPQNGFLAIKNKNEFPCSIALLGQNNRISSFKYFSRLMNNNARFH